MPPGTALPEPLPWSRLCAGAEPRSVRPHPSAPAGAKPSLPKARHTPPRLQMAFMALAFGGPDSYRGRDMRTAHQGLPVSRRAAACGAQLGSQQLGTVGSQPGTAGITDSGGVACSTQAATGQPHVLAACSRAVRLGATLLSPPGGQPPTRPLTPTHTRPLDPAALQGLSNSHFDAILGHFVGTLQELGVQQVGARVRCAGHAHVCARGRRRVS